MSTQINVIPRKDLVDGKKVLVKESATKAGWFTILVMKRVVTMRNGIPQFAKRIGAIRLQKEMLDALGTISEGMDLSAKFQELGASGLDIVRKESIAPQFEGHLPKVNPTTKEVVKDSKGNPIFFQDNVVFLSDGIKDELLDSAAISTAKAAEATPTGAAAKGDLAAA